MNLKKELKELKRKKKEFDTRHPILGECLELAAWCGVGSIVGATLGHIYNSGYKKGYHVGLDDVYLPPDMECRMLYKTNGEMIKPTLDVLQKFNYPNISTTHVTDSGRVASVVCSIDADKLTDYANELIKISGEDIANGAHKVYAHIVTGAEDGIRTITE